MKDFRNIFFISIDALRADHLGCMGYHKNITPNIDKLAKDGTLFKNAFAPGSYTFLSFPSIMSSEYPSEYFISRKKNQTITSILNDHGFITASLNCNPHSRGNLDKNFQYFDDLLEHSEFDKYSERLKRKVVKKVGSNSILIKLLRKSLEKLSSNIAKPYANAELMNMKAFEWLENNKREPIFFWIHYMDPHYPYDPPDNSVNISRKEIARLNRLCWSYLSNKKKSNTKLTRNDIDLIIQLYDGEISYVDKAIGEFINYLKKNELFNDSLIMLFSDHGDMFGEHGKFSHDEYTLYNGQIQVPLIAKGFNDTRKIVDHNVTTRDIYPTILEFINYLHDKEKKRSIYTSKREYIISEGFKPEDIISNSKLNIEKINFSCHWRNWELVYIANENKKELFNLKEDPNEKVNLFDKKEDIATYLTMIIEKHKSRIKKTQYLKNNILKSRDRINI